MNVRQQTNVTARIYHCFDGANHRCLRSIWSCSRVAAGLTLRQRAKSWTPPAVTIVQEAIRPGGLSPGPDRKSTRLNSSHDQISYAVFCLKKKIKSTITLSVTVCRSLATAACRLTLRH